MKKMISTLLMAFIAISLLGQNSTTAKWQATPLNIDGKLTDWQSRPPYFDNLTKLSFDIRNDSSNLYLIFSLPDQRTQFKIARAGLSLTFDTKIKPKRHTGIYFSPFMTEKPGQHKHGSDIAKGPSIIQQKYMISPPDVLASGFAFSDGDIWDNKDEKKVCFFSAWDTLNCMTLEFCIPLRELFGDNYDLNKITTQDITMTLQINALERPETPAGGTEGTMGGNAGGVFQHGNQQNMSGQSSQGFQPESQNRQAGNSDGSSMFESQVLKQKILLTSGKK